MDLEVRPLRVAETSRVVALLTAGESEMRRHLITSSVSGALNNPDATTIGLVAARGDQVLGAAIASSLPGGTGVLVGLRIDSDASTDVARQLYQSLTHYLHSLGVNFLQATCEVKSPPAELIAIDFQHLADLQYLSIDTIALETIGSTELTFAAVDQITDDQLIKLLTQTYIETRDCPSMNQYRSAGETLASYRAAPQFDPCQWRIAMHNDVPVGCVLTMPFTESDALELTYMGIIPSARGNGWGGALVTEAGRIAAAQGLRTINLGVDRNNDPAIATYQRCGFTAFFSEAVWGRRIGR